jgi:hypothetical protein
LEIDFQRGVEGELKWLFLGLTHWVEASEESGLLSKPHEYRRWLDHTISYTKFKTEMWANRLPTPIALNADLNRPAPWYWVSAFQFLPVSLAFASQVTDKSPAAGVKLVWAFWKRSFWPFSYPLPSLSRGEK